MTKAKKPKKESFFAKLKSMTSSDKDTELESLIKATQEDPSDLRARLKLADAYLAREDKLNALNQYLAVAEDYSSRRIYPKAVAVYKQALSIDPNMIKVYIKLAEQYKKLGLMTEVVSQYTKAATIHEKAGRMKEALDVFRMLIDLNPDNPVGRLKLGQRYLNAGFVDEAIGEFLKAAQVFEKQNKPDERRRLFEGLMDRGINNIKIVAPLLKIYLDSGDYQQVIKRVESSKKDFSGAVSIQEMFAEAARSLGQNDQAVQALRQVSELYKKINRSDKVCEACDQILKIDSENVYASETLENLPEEPEPVVEIQKDEGHEIEIELDEEFDVEPEFNEIEIGEISDQIPDAVEESMWDVPEEHRDSAEELDDIEVFGDQVEASDSPADEGPDDEPSPVDEEGDEMSPVADEADVDELSPVSAEDEETAEEAVEEAVEAEPEPEPEPEPELDIPDVDFGSLNDDEARNHLAEIRRQAEEIDLYDDFIAYVDDLTETHDSSLPVLEIQRQHADVRGEVEAKIALTGKMAEAAGAAGDAGLRGRYLEELAELAPDDMAVVELLAAFYEENDPEKALPLYEKLAEDATASENYETTVDFVSKIIEADSARLDAREVLADALIKLDRKKEAIEQLRVIAGRYAADDQNELALQNYRQILTLDQGDLAALTAVKDAHLAAKENDQALAILAQLGRSARDRADDDALEQILREILAVDPEDLDALDQYAQLLEKLDRKDEMVAVLEKAGALHLAAADNDSAEATFNLILDAAPDHSGAMESLADLFIESKRNDEAVDALMKLAKAADKAEDYPVAEKHLATILDLDKGHIDARKMHADILNKSGDLDKALDQFFHLADTHRQAGENDKAISALRDALALDDGNEKVLMALKDLFITTDQSDKAVETLFKLADSARSQGKDDRALGFLGEIAGLDPKHVPSRETIIDIHKAAGKHGAAAAELTTLSQIRQDAGDVEGALRDLQSAMELQPDDTRALSRLKDLYLANGQTDEVVAILMTRLTAKKETGDEDGALDTAAEIIGLDESHLDARTVRKDLLLKKQDVAGAVGELLQIADIHKKAERGDDAEKAILEAVGIDHDNFETRRRLIDFYKDADRAEDAVASLNNALAIAAAAKKDELAVRLAEEILELEGKNIDALKALADLHEKGGDTDKALEKLRELSEISLAADEFENAASFLGRAANLAPANIEVRESLLDISRRTKNKEEEIRQLLELGPLYEQAGRLEDALMTTVTVLDLEPNLGDVLDRQVELYKKTGSAAQAIPVLFKIADMALEHDDATRAAEALEEALSIDEANADALMKLLEIHEKSGDAAKASDCLIRLADLRENAGEFDRALEYVRRIQEMKPDDIDAAQKALNLLDAAGKEDEFVAELLAILGLYKAKGMEAEAVETARRAIAMRPEDGAAHDSLMSLYLEASDKAAAADEAIRFARILAGANDYEGAAKVLNEALDAELAVDSIMDQLFDFYSHFEDRGQSIQGLLQLAGKARSADKHDLEEMSLEFVIELDPANADANNGLKRIYGEGGRTQEAVDLMLAFARVLQEAGDQEKRIEALIEVVELDDGNITALIELKQAAVDDNDAEQALEYMNRLAAVYAQSGRDDDVEAILREVTQLDAGNADAWRKLADHYKKHDRRQDALDALQNALATLADTLAEEELESFARDIIAIDPDNLDAWRALKNLHLARDDKKQAMEAAFTIAGICEKSGDFADAQNAWRDILKIDEDHEGARRSLAKGLAGAGKTDEAASELMILADRFMKDEQYDKAALALREIVDLDKLKDEALSMMKVAYEAQGQHDKRIEVTGQLVEMKIASGDLGDAERNLRELLEMQPDEIAVKEKLAGVLADQDKVSEATEEYFALADGAARSDDRQAERQYLDKIAYHDPDNEKAHERLLAWCETEGNDEGRLNAIDHLLRIYEDGNRVEEREALFHKRLMIDPRDADTQNALATLYVDTGQTDKASLLLFTLSDDFGAEGDFDVASQLLEKITQMDPRNEEAHRKLVDMFLKRDLPEDAVKELCSLAQLCVDNGRPVDADKHIDRGLELDPNNATLTELKERIAGRIAESAERIGKLMAQADAASAAGQNDEAKSLLGRVLELDPSNAEATRRINDLYYREDAVGKSDAGEFFEDVKAEYREEGDVDIEWADQSEEPATAAEEFGVEAEGQTEFAEEAAEEAAEDDVDLLEQVPEEEVSGQEAESEEAAFEEAVEEAELPEAADQAPFEDEVSDMPPADEEDIDLFDEAGETAGEPEIAAEPEDIFETESQAPSDLEEIDLFGEAGEEPALDETIDESPAEDSADLEMPAEEPETIETAEDHEPAASDAQYAVDGMLDDIFGPSAGEGAASSDALDGLIGDIGGGESVITGESFDGLVGEFRGMVVTEDTQDAEAHFSLGIAFREMDQIEDAVVEFEKALALGDPEKEAQIAEQLAQCYMEQENWSQAAPYLEMALDVEDHGLSERERLDCMVDLGETYEKLGQYRKAVNVFKEVDELNADYRGVREKVRELADKPDGNPDDNIGFM